MNLNNKERIEFSEYYGNDEEASAQHEENILDKERESFEEEVEMIKQLNNLKEENKQLKKMNQIQENQISNLEGDLQEALLKIAHYEGKFDVLPQNQLAEQKQNMRLTEEIKKLTLQINKLNLVIDKLKVEKQEEVTLFKDKYNEALKISDLAIANDKKLKQDIINKDKKILKLVEEIEKSQGKVIKKETSTDKQVNDLTNELKNSEKQKNELTQAFKQAMKLISVLKRQKAHLEHCRLLNLNEEKFTQLIQEANNV